MARCDNLKGVSTAISGIEISTPKCEPGIGKTRLTREVGAYARLRGMQVVYGRCPALFRMDGVPPYILWSEVIRNYLEDCNPEQLYRVVGYYPGEVCKLVPDLANRLRSIPPSVPISPEHERDRLFEAVSQFVTNISDRKSTRLNSSH